MSSGLLLGTLSRVVIDVCAGTGYLGGEDQTAWRQYDATELMLSSSNVRAYDDILIDVGTADNFLKGGQLLPEVGDPLTATTGYKRSFLSRLMHRHSRQQRTKWARKSLCACR